MDHRRFLQRNILGFTPQQDKYCDIVLNLFHPPLVHEPNRAVTHGRRKRAPTFLSAAMIRARSACRSSCRLVVVLRFVELRASSSSCSLIFCCCRSNSASWAWKLCSTWTSLAWTCFSSAQSWRKHTREHEHTNRCLKRKEDLADYRLTDLRTVNALCFFPVKVCSSFPIRLNTQKII